MFWRFNLLTSHIDTLLEKEDVTLLEIMDEDDVLQECRAQNRKLIDFLIKQENIEELVAMVIQEPSDELDEKLRYKYPNTACEILTSNNSQVTEKLLEDEELLNRIYAFIESDGPLNPLLASFFSRVMVVLIHAKGEYMFNFLKGKDDFVGHVIRHIGTSAIMEMLIQFFYNTGCGNEFYTWLDEQKLIQRLVGIIHSSETEERHSNASYYLCDYVRASRNSMIQDQDLNYYQILLNTLESNEVLKTLLKNMLEGEKVESVLVSGFAIIETLLEHKRIEAEGTGQRMPCLYNDTVSKAIASTVEAVLPSLGEVHQLLLDPPSQRYCPMPTTVGNMDPPLGNTRLQVAKLIATLLDTSLLVHSELGKLNTVDVLLDLFFKYSLNNFLHLQVESCINTILNNVYSAEGENKVESPLLGKLFTEYRIINRILDNWEDNDVNQSQPGGHRKGYMGHLTRIANRVSEAMAKGNHAEKVKEIFLELPDDVRDKWDNFVSGTLAEVNKQNTVDLVGSHPLHSSSDEDAEFNIPFQQDTAMQQAFTDYQLQQMTSNFIDQFGFNEEEFAEQEERVEAPFSDRISSIDFDICNDESSSAATLFEQACKERMQQFDEHDSDEDIWEDKEVTLSSPPQSGTQSRRDAANSDSDESTDSEEELDSPAVIRQIPANTSEKMDVDTAEWQANFDDISMDTGGTPVAMDTNSPWDGGSGGTSEAVNTSAGWADFAKPTDKPQTADTWADFANFSPVNSSNLNSTEPGPRSSSPDVMDIADSTTNASTPRQAAYLVSSAPADLATEVVSSTSASDHQERNNNSCTEDSGVTSSTTSSSPPSSSEQVNHADNNVSSSSQDADTGERAVSSAVPIPQHDNTPFYRGPPPFDISTSPPDDDSPLRDEDNDDDDAEHQHGNKGYDDDDDDDDLSANFNFLAASGMMRSMEGAATSSTPDENTISTEEAAKIAEQKRIEEARAQAKEALEQYMSTTQNGPV